MNHATILASLQLSEQEAGTFSGIWTNDGPPLVSVSPADGKPIGTVTATTAAEYERVARQAVETFMGWRELPAPQRGEIVLQMGAALREHKQALAKLVTLECGKILSEAEGEVQEMIDIAHYAVGLSRTIGGVTLPSERPNHRLFEQWHPLGPTGVISAFNFPVAVWSWNAMIALIAGDTVVWKPSEKTPLCAVAVTKLMEPIAAAAGFPGLLGLVIGGGDLGEQLAGDQRFPLISATGSCRMGRAVASTVAGRMGRSLLELGGNNAIVVCEDADLDLALRAIAFGAVGTAGQRCTTTRRLIVEESIADELASRLVNAYRTIQPGDPLDEGTLLGPLIDGDAVSQFERAIQQLEAQGGEVLCGGNSVDRPGFYVEPTIARARSDMPIVAQETFAPILYVLRVGSLDEAIAVHNSVSQGLSSAIFTRSHQAAERFLAASGSDCGIANVNVGTSGAEIGGAFGGEKETGGGREAGSDSWKAYMRRQTCTVNYGSELPLAQGVKFDV